MQLGELEKLVLNYLWENEAANAKEVHHHFEDSRGGTLNTIQSTLDRLFKKGLLQRVKKSHAFIYSPAMERSALLGSLISDITTELAKDDSESVLEAFVDISSTLDTQSLEKLQNLITSKNKLLENTE